jgi:hypothetical protein
MSKTYAAILVVVALGALLMGFTTGCGSGGTTTNGGVATFVANFLASEVRIDQALPVSFGHAQLPVCCASGSTIHAVWEDYRNGQSDILFNTSTDGGATWQASNTRIDTGTQAGAVRAVRPSICCSGNNIYVAWVETMGFSALSYYFNRSTDGGATWLANRVKVDTHPTPLNAGSNPQVCCCNNTNTVVVTWSDNRSGNHQVYGARSTDAGTTWSEQHIGGMAGFDATDPLCCCEQVAMVQYVYVAWTDTRLGGGERVFFDRSTDGGATWGADTNLDATPSFFVSDICCDAQYVYVAWLGADGSRIARLRGSSDFGATFNAEQQLKTAVGGLGAFPRLCCEGATVRAVFTDDTAQPDIYFNTSTDAGVSVLANQVRIDNGMAGDQSRSPIICCNGNNLTCMFMDDRSGTWDVWASRSTDGGTTWSMDVRLDMAGGAVDVQNFHGCCSGSNVYALYTDERDGIDRAQVQVNASADAGANWFANDVRVSQPLPPGGNATTSNICFVAKGTTLHAVFSDDRLGQERVFYNRSTDGGLTWQPTDLLLDPGMAGTEDRGPMTCCSGNNVYVAWWRTYAPSGNADIYVNRSIDGGLTWQPAPTRINTGVAVDSTPTGTPVICCNGLSVVVGWNDGRNGDSDIFINRSPDAGMTWLATAQRVDSAMAGDNAFSPRICCEGSRIHLAWEDDRNGDQDIFTNRSTNGGVTWQPMDTRLDVGDAAGAHHSYAIALCCDGTHVHVAWEDERSGDTDVYVASSSDGGATFSSDQRLDVGAAAGMGDSGDVVLCCEGTRVYAAYEDERDGSEDIYFNRSLDGGTTWLAADVRVDLGDAPGAANSDGPAICCDGDRVYIAWDEARASNPGPYFSASLDAGTTWMPAPVRISATPQTAGGQQKIACTPDFVYVAWVHSTNGAQDAVINRTAP